MSEKHYCDMCNKEISGTYMFSVFIEINSPIFFNKHSGYREYCEECLLEFDKFVTPYLTDADIDKTRKLLDDLRSALKNKDFKKNYKRLL